LLGKSEEDLLRSALRQATPGEARGHRRRGRFGVVLQDDE